MSSRSRCFKSAASWACNLLLSGLLLLLLASLLSVCDISSCERVATALELGAGLVVEGVSRPCPSDSAAAAAAVEVPCGGVNEDPRPWPGEVVSPVEYDTLSECFLRSISIKRCSSSLRLYGTGHQDGGGHQS